MNAMLDALWRDFEAAAEEAGLNVRVAVQRPDVDAAFAWVRQRRAAGGPAALVAASPGDWAPEYRWAIVLGSAGRRLWERLQALPEVERAAQDPLDHLTERSIEPLLVLLRKADPGVQSAFPFRHVRQLVPFHALTQHLPWACPTPLGILVHPRVGPWFAWRAALFTTLEPPRRMEEHGASPCTTCPAPCVTACPAHAADKRGFDWQACAEFRLRAVPCRETCLARQACPAGPVFRYGPDQLAYHYGTSLRMLRRWKDGAADT